MAQALTLSLSKNLNDNILPFQLRTSISMQAKKELKISTYQKAYPQILHILAVTPFVW